jgi:hypothetical protein
MVPEVKEWNHMVFDSIKTPDMSADFPTSAAKKTLVMFDFSQLLRFYHRRLMDFRRPLALSAMEETSLTLSCVFSMVSRFLDSS